MVEHKRDWRVLDREYLSDHHDIEVIIGLNQDEIKCTHVNMAKGYRVTAGRTENFLNHIATRFVDQAEQPAGLTIEAWYDIIVEGCSKAFTKKTTRQRSKAVYWWSPEIATIRAETLHKRRTMTMKRKKNNVTETELQASITEYKEQRKILKSKRPGKSSVRS